MRSNVLFLGSKGLGLEVLKEMLSLSRDSVVGAITIDDRTDRRSAYDEFLILAENEGLELRIAKNRRHAEQLIVEFNPDLCFVVGWYWLISRETLESVSRGFIGIHNSLLPKYRGSSPLVWAIINGETEVGFSVFSFTEGMDDGKIWATGKLEISENDYVSDIMDKLEMKTVEVMRTVYPKILDGSAVPFEQNPNGVTYCSPRFNFDGVIDWNKSAKEIHNFVRAQSEPYPGAFTYFKDAKLIIWKARLSDNRHYGTPGQVARVYNKGVVVICGDARAVVLETVEFNGIKANAEKVIKSVRTRFPRTPFFKE